MSLALAGIVVTMVIGPFLLYHIYLVSYVLRLSIVYVLELIYSPELTRQPSSISPRSCYSGRCHLFRDTHLIGSVFLTHLSNTNFHSVNDDWSETHTAT